MRKICSNCMNVFEANTPLEFCPLVDCGEGHLIEIDDFLVDIIKKLWERGVITRFSCASHLEDICSNMYIMFDGVYLEDFNMNLNEFRNWIIELNIHAGKVRICNMEYRNDADTFVVSGLCEATESDPRKRLKCQIAFAEFFYDLIDNIDALSEKDILDI